MSKRSKVWLVRSNDSGTIAEKELIYEYQPGVSDKATSPNDFLGNTGIVLEHDGPALHFVLDGNVEAPPTNLIAYKIYDTRDVSHLEGELLTIVDAMFGDKQQREALKSLIRQTVWKFNSRKEEQVRQTFLNVGKTANVGKASPDS